ncbi:MAG: hypothetical protein ACE5JQ_01940 [Candidatus Methylomirabilales bacterium]
MEKLSLESALRYLVVGYVILGVFYVCRPDDTGRLYGTLGSVGIPVAAFVAGSLVYLIYRPVLYNALLFHVIDRIHKGNVRQLLMNRYEITSRFEAELLWKVIQSESVKEKLSPLLLASAGIHLLYMTSLVTVTGAVFLFFDTGFSPRSIYLLVLAILMDSSAVISDYQMEKQESLLFTLIGKSDIDQVVSKAGYKRKESSA